MSEIDYKNQTFAPGFFVAVIVREETTPDNGYVGQIQAIDDRGVRLTLIDWAMGDASSWDIFLPWSNIEAALISTPERDESSFGEAALDWLNKFNSGKSLNTEI